MNWYIKVLQNYANFSGRAARTEYWMFILFNFLITIGLAFIDGILGLAIPVGPAAFGVLQTVYGLAVFIPSLAVMARRFHDIGKTGWMFLVNLIPCAGFIIFLIWMAKEGDRGSNQYGSDPLGRGKRKGLREEEYEDESYEDDPEDRPRGGRARDDDEDDRPPQPRPRPRRDDR